MSDNENPRERMNEEDIIKKKDMIIKRTTEKQNRLMKEMDIGQKEDTIIQNNWMMKW